MNTQTQNKPVTLDNQTETQGLNYVLSLPNIAKILQTENYFSSLETEKNANLLAFNRSLERAKIVGKSIEYLRSEDFTQILLANKVKRPTQALFCEIVYKLQRAMSQRYIQVYAIPSEVVKGYISEVKEANKVNVNEFSFTLQELIKFAKNGKLEAKKEASEEASEEATSEKSTFFLNCTNHTTKISIKIAKDGKIETKNTKEEIEQIAHYLLNLVQTM